MASARKWSRGLGGILGGVVGKGVRKEVGEGVGEGEKEIFSILFLVEI